MYKKKIARRYIIIINLNVKLYSQLISLVLGRLDQKKMFYIKNYQLLLPGPNLNMAKRTQWHYVAQYIAKHIKCQV